MLRRLAAANRLRCCDGCSSSSLSTLLEMDLGAANQSRILGACKKDEKASPSRQAGFETGLLKLEG